MFTEIVSFLFALGEQSPVLAICAVGMLLVMVSR